LPIYYNSSAPRYTGAGAWSFDLMQGYTSVGTGSSVVPARFNCPPEVTLHRLTRGEISTGSSGCEASKAGAKSPSGPA
jgi:hypothetical protein